MRKKVLVLGSNFGGLTAALAVRHELHGDVDVTVVSPNEHFLFTPSLIWLPFGKRDRADITFPVAPTLDSHGIEFVAAAATRVDPVAKKVTVGDGREFGYDYLVVATGYRNKDDVVPGFKENANTITTLAEAERTRSRLVAVPRRPRRRRHRRHPGSRLLRRGVRVPLQHGVPAEEGQAA